jgi:hypothetical protein
VDSGRAAIAAWRTWLPVAPPPAELGHVAGVEQRHAVIGGERERFLEPHERRVAVHQHLVDPAPRPLPRLGVAAGLFLQLQDVTDRRQDARPRTRRIDALEQRNELEAQAPPAEGERLEQHHGRGCRIERGEQLLHALAPILVVDRPAGRVA